MLLKLCFYPCPVDCMPALKLSFKFLHSKKECGPCATLFFTFAALLHNVAIYNSVGYKTLFLTQAHPGKLKFKK